MLPEAAACQPSVDGATLVAQQSFDVKINRQLIYGLFHMDKPLLYAVNSAGGPVQAARACSVSRQAVDKWVANGYLPRTEYTGETDYARRLSEAAAARGVDFSPAWLLTAAAPGAGSGATEGGASTEQTAATSASPGIEDRRHAKLQSVTPRRGRRAGDLTAVQFTQRLANAKAGEFPPEFKATDEYLDD